MPVILVTRSATQASTLINHLTRYGAEVLALPTIQTTPCPLPAHLPPLTTFQWLIFTSTNGVNYFFEQLPAGLTFPGRIAAVGQQTAHALTHWCQQAAVVPARFTAADLPAVLGDVAGQHILLPQGNLARPELAQLLQEAGAMVYPLTIYHTSTPPADPAVLQRLAAGVDGVTFTSPSTFAGFYQLCGTELAQKILQTAVVACIGPTTAQAVQTAGFTVHLIPADHTAAGLAEMIAHHFGLKEKFSSRTIHL